jgi:hypothetical protein
MPLKIANHLVDRGLGFVASPERRSAAPRCGAAARRCCRAAAARGRSRASQSSASKSAISTSSPRRDLNAHRQFLADILDGPGRPAAIPSAARTSKTSSANFAKRLLLGANEEAARPQPPLPRSGDPHGAAVSIGRGRSCRLWAVDSVPLEPVLERACRDPDRVAGRAEPDRRDLAGRDLAADGVGAHSKP